MGHIIVAESLGYDTELHYGSMSFDTSALNDKLDSIYVKNRYQIENDLPYEQKKQFDETFAKLVNEGVLVTLGGPIQTIFTGITGLIILFVRRKKIQEQGLKLPDWLAVFLSLFWLREVFNLFHSIIFELIYKEENYFGGDERYISEYFGLGSGTLPIILGITGLLISLLVIFKVLPGKLQFPFILSGLKGGISGFIFWFEFLGPVLLP
ncbi:hypothetical protein ML462_14580 [Gramella lutea]|uniref:Uncharacterized protein n=1 Tax=Christiangramia lutea TaxID=1607951 RepID=A0A9X2ABM5_9FLAO|nr:hypothetical protein [Christiangramia lutea]MCH4824396.1 hypothetical protein [Christiangramia lutea]